MGKRGGGSRGRKETGEGQEKGQGGYGDGGNRRNVGTGREGMHGG